MGRLRGSMLIATLTTVALLGAGCGDDSGDSAGAPTDTASTTPADATSDDLPACGSVWVADQDLPEDYQGCTSLDGAIKPEILDCSSGQRLVLFNDEFWAVRGHVIKRAPEGLSNSQEYADVLYSCRA